MRAPSSVFGELLRQTREAAGLTRAVVGERAGLDVSHVYRMEVGGRRPSRESALALADALEVRGDAHGQWLTSAGFAQVPLMTSVRGAVRTRGGARRPAARLTETTATAASEWERLRSIGLAEDRLARLLRAMESSRGPDRQRIAPLVSAVFDRLADGLECTVRTAVVPAAGGQHRLLAPHVTQRLLLRAVREAVDAGVARVVLVIAPGMDEAFAPLKEALELSIVPRVALVSRTQAVPNGLGDAILAAEAEVGDEPFVVVLPDDVIGERQRGRRTGTLKAMLAASMRFSRAHMVAVMPLPKSTLARSGAVLLGAREVAPRVFRVTQLVEKPQSGHAVLRHPHPFGIVGRYILNPSIFEALQRARARHPNRVELTEALADRRAGREVYTFELEASRHDVGELVERAHAALGTKRG